MTATRRPAKPLTVNVAETRHSGVIEGPVRAIHPAIKKIGCAWQYDHARHAYLVPRQALDDIMVAIEVAGHIVNYAAPLW